MAGGRLAGKVALITGAGRGFGHAIARAFAREGARVAANYLGSRAGAEAVVAEAARLGAEAVALRGDVAREDDVRALVAATLERFGRLDVLVNNAGIMVRGPLLAVPAEECRRMFDVNVTGTMLCSRHALGPMIAQKGGRIINLSSQLAQRAVGVHGITVNAIAPGGIDTDMSRDVMTPEYRTRRLAELPLHRFGSADDVAYCAIVLASDEAGYLTGQILHPSGGWVSG